MGQITKTVIENLTDKVAAMVAVELASAGTCRASWSKDTLYNIIDQLNDPSVEIALGSATHRVDTSMLPESFSRHVYQQLLQTIAHNTPHTINMVADAARVSLYTALRSFVRSEAGGGHEGFGDYCNAVSARIHPYFAEIAYTTDTSAFSVAGGSLAPNAFAPRYTTIPPKKAYVGTAGSWVDDTADAVDVDASDVPFFASNNACIVLGFDRKVSAIAVQLGTVASSNCNVEFKYSVGGSNYGTLTVTDGTVGMTGSEIITFTPPSDWVPTNLDTAGNYYDSADKVPMYYIQMKRTAATVTTTPIATWFRGVPTRIYAPQPSKNGVSANPYRLSGLVDQPPLAILRLTSTSGGSISVLPGTDITSEYGYFDFPKNLKFQVLTITGGGNSNTITMGYVDQSGNNDSKVQSAWDMTSATVGTEWPSGSSFLTFNTGDTGMRKVTASEGWAATANTTKAILALVNHWERTPTL